MWPSYLRLKENFTINSKMIQDDIKRTLQENTQEASVQNSPEAISDNKYFEGEIDGFSFTIQNPRRSRKGPTAPLIRGEIEGSRVHITVEPDKIMLIVLCFICVFPILAILSVLKGLPNVDFYQLFVVFIITIYVTAIFVFFKAAGVRDVVYLNKILNGEVEEWQRLRNKTIKQ